MIRSKFNLDIIFYLFAAAAFSMMISLFIIQLFAGLLSLFWLFESYENKKKAFNIFSLLLVIFGIIRILSILLSNFPFVSYTSFYKDALFYFSFFSMSFYSQALEKDKIRKIIDIFILGALLVALIGILQFNLKLVERAEAFSSGYATYSSFLIAALGLFTFIPYRRLKKLKWILFPFGISIFLSGIITSQGRTNIVIAITIIIIAIILKKINFRSVIIIVVLTVAISFISFSNNKKEITQRVENPATLSDRNIILKGAEHLAFNHPLLGYGPRTFHQIFPFTNQLADKRIGSWHNDFIQVYFESGILGLLAFCALITSALWLSFKFYYSEKINLDNKNMSFGIFLAITALVLSALTAGFIDSPVLSIEFAFFVSLLPAQIVLPQLFPLDKNE